METNAVDVLTLSLSLLVARGIVTENEVNEAKDRGYDGLFDLLNKKYYESEMVE